jgi:hypothetical protein
VRAPTLLGMKLLLMFVTAAMIIAFLEFTVAPIVLPLFPLNLPVALSIIPNRVIRLLLQETQGTASVPRLRFFRIRRGFATRA